MRDPIRVLLADDHIVMRQGLAMILSDAEGIEVVGQADGGRAALALVAQLAPDVLVLDYSMKDLQGPEVLASLRQGGSPVAVLMLSNYEQMAYARQAMAGGAKGYVVKSAAAPELVDAIRAVHRGEQYLSQSLVPQLTAALGGSARPQGLDALSAREFELIRHIGRGRSLLEASQEMDVGESTAATYRQRIMKKLDLRSTAEIIKFAVEHKLAD